MASSAVRRNKYGVRTDAAGKAARTVDGIIFASAAEAKRYGVLRLMERAGEIKALELQPRFPCKVGAVLVCTYVGDFSYIDVKTGALVIEDVKGVKTPAYRIKAKLMKAVHGIEVREITR